MSALLKKEIRLLLPSFVTALGLALSVWLIPVVDLDSGAGWRSLLVVFPFALCPAMAVVTALDSFGRELSAGMFTDLLAQPVSRLRVWWTKTSLLAGALALIAAVWWLSFVLHRPSRWTPQNLHDMTVTVVLFGLAVFSGGLWTVLLLRQAAAGFWITLLVPAALATAVATLMEKHPEKIESVLIAGFTLYAIAGFFWAQRMFLRAQDVQWTGGTIAMPHAPWMGAWTAGHGARRRRHPWVALLAKEFQLHQSQLVIAGGLVLLHLGVLAARKLGGGFKTSPIAEFCSSNFWILWLAMPVLLGCAAVAEERKLGTLESQLCLPVRRRTQFVFKFVVVFLVSVLLGVIVPVLLEGTRILPDLNMISHRWQMPDGRLLDVPAALGSVISFAVPFTQLLAIAASVVAIAFYASTLARSTLQSLTPAVLGILGTWLLLLRASEIENVIHYPLWRGWLIYLIGMPVMTLTLVGLAYWNFKRLLVGWRVWRRNAFVLLGSLALVITVTTGIYQRVWEFLTPLEPRHGPARLPLAQGIQLQGDGSDLFAHLPGGRIWTDRFLLMAPNLWAKLAGGRFLEGTNWASVARCYRDLVAIRHDGSLWVSAKPEDLAVIKHDGSLWVSATPEDPDSFWRPRNTANAEPVRFVRVGHDNGWKRVAAPYPMVILLKIDGTLWRLGTNHVRRQGWPGLRAFEPERLGTDSDWAELSVIQGRLLFRKRDGQAWVYSSGSGSRQVLRLEEQIVLERAPLNDGQPWRAVAWLDNRRGPGCALGVRDDGTLHVLNKQLFIPHMSFSATELAKLYVRLGHESRWLTVVGTGESSVTLKDDGTLWRWDFPEDPFTQPETARATRFSSHSDWVGLCAHVGGMIGLAADGSLWYWQSEFGRYFGHPRLLAASRKPQRIGSVLGRSE